MHTMNSRESLSRWILAAVTFAAASLTGAVRVDAGSEADYHDVSEMEADLWLLDGAAGGRMTVHEIGRSTLGQSILAVHLAALDSSGNQPEDAADKPALLIEAGTHAREWAGPELTFWFLGQFLLASAITPERIDDILDHASIWVIPMVNPDGRAMDDTHGGDPEQYWTNSFWHPSGTDHNGWRDNVEMVSCSSHFLGYTYGIDLNRNYSAGWDDPAATADEWDCTDNEYHGAVPFQAREANVLRRFVNNRMISMSISVHAYGAYVGNPRGYTDIPENFRDVWNAAVPSELAITRSSTPGSGFGQFTSWMASPSDTPHEADMGTRRGVFSLLLELPPGHWDEYEGNSPYPSTYPYRWTMSDGSNAFHPSDQDFIYDSLDGFYDALTYLAEQARSTWCPLDPGTLAPDASYVNDLGLTGSKIAPCTNCRGSLDFLYDGDGACEVMSSGSNQVVYRVQNFDHTTGTVERTRVTVVISSRPSWPTPYSTDLIDTQYHDLGPGGAATGDVSFTFQSNRDYLVNIQVSPTSVIDDTVPDNDRHQFRFRVLE